MLTYLTLTKPYESGINSLSQDKEIETVRGLIFHPRVTVLATGRGLKLGSVTLKVLPHGATAGPHP